MKQKIIRNSKFLLLLGVILAGGAAYVYAANSGSGSVTINVPAGFSGSATVQVGVSGQNANNNTLSNSLTVNLSSGAASVNGVCGSNNGQNFYSLAGGSAGACSPGTESGFSGSGPWGWNCNGSGGGSNVSCSANKKIDGVCGTACGVPSYSAPSGNLCTYNDSASQPTIIVSGTGPWTWVCKGSNGGADVPGTASKKQDGVCGPAATTYVSSASAYAGAYCSVGAQSSSPAFPASGSSASWTCSGISSGNPSGLCTATHSSSAVVNGVCGSSNGQNLYSAPTGNLCNAGTASVSGSWNWSCVGSGSGHTDASCSANQKQDGVCGPWSTSYPFSASGYGAGSYCSVGSQSASPGFPAAGSSSSWTCSGVNSGNISGTCTAAHSASGAVNGACGPAATSYISTATSFSGSLCNAGSTVNSGGSSISPSFPSSGSSTTWYCSGSGGGAQSSACTASRASSGTCVAVTNLQPSSSVTPVAGKISLTFDAMPGATNYFVRLDDAVNSPVYDDPRFAGRCNPHYYCENYIPSSSICSGGTCTITNIPVTSGRTYTYWVSEDQISNSSAICSLAGSATFTVVDPAQAICDNTWRREPSGGWADKQTVGAYVSSALNTQFKDTIYMVVTGGGELIYGQPCTFSGSSCNFGGWTSLTASGVTNNSPFLWIGSAPDVYYLSYSNQVWHNINWASGWTGWVNMGVQNNQNYTWGRPFRTQDKNGQWWQFKTDPSTGNIMYNCGSSQACVDLNYAGGSFSPASVASKGAFTAICDFNAYNDSTIPVIGDGSTDAACAFVNFSPGSKANFNCTAPTAGGSYSVRCAAVAGNPDNICAESNFVGNLTVSPATGTIAVRYTIDGVPQSANQAITYSIAGPTAVASGSYTVNNTSSHTLRNVGSYTFTYTSGAPAGKVFSSVTPSVTQNLTAAGTITYTINFVSAAVCNPATVGTDRMSGCNYNGMNFNSLVGGVLTGPVLSNPAPANGTPLPFQDWGGSGPNGLVDNYSIRFKGRFNFTAGTYTFSVGSDDGSRAYFDDNLDGVPDSGYFAAYWLDRGYSVTVGSPVNVSAGNHVLVYEFYEDGGGAAYSLSWTATFTCPAGNVTLTPASVLTGASSSAGAPAGWSGGTYASSNTAVATVSGSTITGVSAGSSNISGTGWTANNGAVNCSLASRALTVTVPLPNPPGGGASPNPGGYNNNSVNPPGGGSVACNFVRLAWRDNSDNETGFKIYKDGAYLTTAPASSPASATGGTLTYEFNPGDTNVHNYAIAATGAGGDSVQVDLQNNGIAAIVCAPNLGTSDKDIVAINGAVVPSTGSCNGTDPLPANTQLNLGNKVKFSINLCNSGTLPATGISVTDKLTNLIKPSTGWKAMYDDGSGEVPIATAGISLDDTGGTDPNKILKFTNIPDVPVAPVIPPAVRRITFEAQLSVPINYSATSARFQNGFTVSYNAGTFNKFTPLILFYTGKGIPTIIEIP